MRCRHPARTPRRAGTSAAAAAVLLSLAGCTSTGLFSSDTIDYRTEAVKTRPLDVPPDLTQLARESRYQTLGGSVSASTAAAAAAAAAPAAATAPAVAIGKLDNMRIERAGQQRWLVVSGQTPEQLWPKLKGFWEQTGFRLTLENPQAGLMETNWSENRAKLPNDVLRNTLGKFFGGLYDTGQRDRYRTRIERTASGSEIYVAHRGLEEVGADALQETFKWRARPSDPELEAEMLSRLMLVLAPKAEPERVRAQVANAPEVPARAQLIGPEIGRASCRERV